MFSEIDYHGDLKGLKILSPKTVYWFQCLKELIKFIIYLKFKSAESNSFKIFIADDAQHLLEVTM